jgi:hypothetical protein
MTIEASAPSMELVVLISTLSSLLRPTRRRRRIGSVLDWIHLECVVGGGGLYVCFYLGGGYADADGVLGGGGGYSTFGDRVSGMRSSGGR